MFLRRIALLALPAALVAATGCSSLYSISISPASGAVSVSVGQTAQYKAYGVKVMGSGTPTTDDITNSVQWSVTNPSIASISSSGVATALAAGHTTIYATSGGTTASTDITVVAPGSSGSGSGTPFINIIPGSAAAGFTGETTQFIALGTLTNASTTVQDLTSTVSWSSSDVSVATIDKNGLATAVGVGAGTTTITAIGTTTSGSLINNTATLTVSGTGAVTLPSLAVYMTGSGTGTVTGCVLTGGATTCSQNIINCTSGTSPSCTASFPLNSLVTLFATTTGHFGGWSSNCITLSGPPPNPLACTVQLNNNKAVGAIFNP